MDIRTGVATALATSALANLAYIVVVLPDETSLSLGFFASHLCFLLAIHLALAIVLAGRAGDRLWAAVVLALPIAGAALPLVQARFGARGIVGLTALLACFLLASVLPARIRGAPLVAAAVGGVVSSHFVVFRQGLMSQDVAWSDASVLAVWVLGGIAVTALAGRTASWIRVPPAWSSCAIALAAVGLGALLSAGDEDPLPLAGPPAASTGSFPPVVLVVLDTVRADHLSLYGYERETTPFLTRFVRERGVLVRNAYANGGWSLPTHASLFTGLYPPRHGAHATFEDDPDGPPSGAYRLPAEIPTLAEILVDAGYWTVGVSANFGPASDLFGLDRGFQHYDARQSDAHVLSSWSPWRIPRLPFSLLAPVAAFLDRWPPFAGCDFFLGVRYRRAREITSEALEVVEAAGDRPFFLFVNYMDAHQPYSPPGHYRYRYPGVRWRIGLHGLDNSTQLAVLRGERSLSVEESEHVRALYDGELAYLDRELQRLLNGLSAHAAWSEMLLVITSDHGEALGEHGQIGHGYGLYEELISIPLVLKPGSDPDAPASGTMVEGPVESVDVFSTVLDHAGVAAPAAVDGVPWGRDRTYARSWLYSNDPLHAGAPSFDRERIAVIKDGWKLIKSSSGEVELYHLDDDPDELEDLAGTRPERRRELSALVGPRDSRVPGELSDEDAERLERLRALGYAL